MSTAPHPHPPWQAPFLGHALRWPFQNHPSAQQLHQRPWCGLRGGGRVGDAIVLRPLVCVQFSHDGAPTNLSCELKQQRTLLLAVPWVGSEMWVPPHVTH